MLAAMSTDLKRFAKEIGLQRAAPNRYSLLLASHILALYRSTHLKPRNVVTEIDAIENRRKSSMKGPTKFKKPPLQGLWHQHYRHNSFGSMVANMLAALNSEGVPTLRGLVRQSEHSSEPVTFDEAHARQAIEDVVRNNIRRREKAGELTGNWLVFAKYGGLNYYLCLHRHEANDDICRRRIEEICCNEFPFLRKLLARGSTSHPPSGIAG